MKGKEACSQEALTHFELFFKYLNLEPVIRSWNNPIPQAWCVHLSLSDSSDCDGVGSGRSKDEALLSAYEVLVKKLSTLSMFFPYVWNFDQNVQWYYHPQEKWVEFHANLKEQFFDQTFWTFIDDCSQGAREEMIPKFLLSRNLLERTDICGIPFKNDSRDKTVWIPQNFIDNVYDSNGVCWGKSEFEAKVKGLCQIIEGYVRVRIISEEIIIPDIPQVILCQHQQIQQSIKELDKLGFEILFKDASLGGKFPAICSILTNPSTGGVMAAFGCHPNFKVALTQSFTKLLEDCELEDLCDLKMPSFHYSDFNNPKNFENHFLNRNGILPWTLFSKNAHFKFFNWNFSIENPIEQWKYLKGLIKDLGKEIYIADYSHLGEQVYRVIVPDLSEIHPVTTMWNANSNAHNDIIKAFFQLEDINKLSYVNHVNGLFEGSLSQDKSLADFLGVLYEEGDRLAQMKLSGILPLIHITLQNYEKASNELGDIDLQSSNKQWNKEAKVLKTLCELQVYCQDMDQYREGMTKVFGEECVLKAEKFFRDKDIQVFLGERLSPKYSKRHNNLMNILKKVIMCVNEQNLSEKEK